MAESQETATGNEKRGNAISVLVGILAVIFLALIVFPGFLAAPLSRTSAGVYLDYSHGWAYGPVENKWTPVLKFIFYPSNKLMNCSSGIFGFYFWQYAWAGGVLAIPA